MQSLAARRIVVLSAAAALSTAVAAPAFAQERHELRGPRIELDARYHHDRYYPAHGMVVESLPVGSVSVGFGPARYYYHAGVWFRPAGVRFEVIAPPPGVVIPVLPSGYVSLTLAGTRYFYANGVYYTAAPSGFVVVAPPPGADTAIPAGDAPPLPAPPPAPPGTVAAHDLVVYPRNGQTEAQKAADQRDCRQWADGQPGAASDPGLLDRALSACLDGRGYTVR